MQSTQSPSVDFRVLADRLVGDVAVPEDEAWDGARLAWNLSVIQQPVAVVYPESADDVVATVAFAERERHPDRLSAAAATTPARSTGTTTPCC